MVCMVEIQHAWSFGAKYMHNLANSCFYLKLKHDHATNLARIQLDVCSTKTHKLDTNGKMGDQVTFFMLKENSNETSNTP